MDHLHHYLLLHGCLQVQDRSQSPATLRNHSAHPAWAHPAPWAKCNESLAETCPGLRQLAAAAAAAAALLAAPKWQPHAAAMMAAVAAEVVAALAAVAAEVAALAAVAEDIAALAAGLALPAVLLASAGAMLCCGSDAK